MKVKRILFVISLMVLFGCCFYVMNQHYDELARYPYELNEEQRSVVLEHLDAEGIDYLVSQKIEPDQFLPYIEVDNFVLNNTLWYDKAIKTRTEDVAYVINFINKYRGNIQFSQLDALLKNYDYNVLTRFYDESSLLKDTLTLIADPTNRYAMIKRTQTLYTYEPEGLRVITGLPHDNMIDGIHDIMLKEEVIEPLHDLLVAAKEINQKEFGDMTIVVGYLSYEDQVAILDTMKTTYGDDFAKRWDQPGQSEYQLGYTVSLRPNGETANQNSLSVEEKEQATWLKENAYKYGFILRFPKTKENVTDKAYQPYTLRYVGKELAKVMYDQDKAMEEMDFTAIK